MSEREAIGLPDQLLIPRLPRGVDPRPREISLVALLALPTFRSPYAGGFFEAASRVFASSVAFATNETLGSLLLRTRG